MKRKMIAMLMAMVCMSSALAYGQAAREDVIWARTTTDVITLDGVLDEAAWAAAETKIIEFGVDAGIPGSGWKMEAGWPPVDPTYATLKYLVRENQLYLGAVVNDQSIGGSLEFNRFDGFLMGLKDHADLGHPKPVSEYLYSWWYPETTDPQPTTRMPSFLGRWGNAWPPTDPRTPEQIAAWDAVTVVDGLQNDDATVDTGYTVEMRFDLGVMGYDVTQPAGDVIEWNISVYDTDWFWPLDPLNFCSNRVWWQGPWGNNVWYDEVRIFARPDVTTASGPVPVIAPELVINEIDAVPVIDGMLDDAVWSDAEVYSFDIRWDDDALRETYPGVGSFRAGQYQPIVNGSTAYVLDPADATVSMFVNGDMLYMGFESRDLVVQYDADFSRWDGFLVTIDDREVRHSDNNLLSRRLAFQVGADGTAVPQNYLASMVVESTAEIALSLMAGTTVDTLGVEPDTGFTAELAVDLTALGYPSGLGDGVFFPGVTLLDGDSFTPFTDSYGTRTWWFREYDGNCCPAWAHFDTDGGVPVDDGGAGPDHATTTQSRNATSRPLIMYALPERSLVTVEVYDLRGRLVERRSLGAQGRGEFQIPLFEGDDHAAGLYLYQLRLVDPESGAERTALRGKTIYLK
ncbi:hypothetical protein KKG45_01230 [bacterium]|nr:hypothetical protein [bacterium]